MNTDYLIDIDSILKDVKSLGECEIKLKSHFARNILKKQKHIS